MARKKGLDDLYKSQEVCSFRRPNLKSTKMLLTKEQLSEQMRKHAEKKNGLHDLMEIIKSKAAAVEQLHETWHKCGANRGLYLA